MVRLKPAVQALHPDCAIHHFNFENIEWPRIVRGWRLNKEVNLSSRTPRAILAHAAPLD